MDKYRKDKTGEKEKENEDQSGDVLLIELSSRSKGEKGDQGDTRY